MNRRQTGCIDLKMYKISLVALATLSVIVVMAEIPKTPEKVHYDISNAKVYFDEFVKKFNRVYKDDEDRKVHFEAFVKNLHKINEMNEKSTSAVFGINKFADYTEEERKFMHGIRLPERREN